MHVKNKKTNLLPTAVLNALFLLVQSIINENPWVYYLYLLPRFQGELFGSLLKTNRLEQ